MKIIATGKTLEGIDIQVEDWREDCNSGKTLTLSLVAYPVAQKTEGHMLAGHKYRRELVHSFIKDEDVLNVFEELKTGTKTISEFRDRISGLMPKVCPKCGGTKFTVTAYLTQDWLVDEHGNFMEVIGDCEEITHLPDNDDVWNCNQCGHSAPGSEFEETLMFGTIEADFGASKNKETASEEETITLSKASVTSLIKSYIDELENQEVMRVEIDAILLDIFPRQVLEELGFC